MRSNRFRGQRIANLKRSWASFTDTVAWAFETALPALKMTLIWVLIMGFAYSGWVTISRSAYFTVRTVKLDRTTNVSREVALELAGLEKNVNIFSFDERSARTALLSHPWVANAHIKRRLPSTIEIGIQERKPAGVLVLGELFLVDDEGHDFVEAKPSQVIGLPLITGLTLDDFNESRDEARELVRSALSLARSYEQSPISVRCPLSAVHIGVGKRLELMLGRTRIMLGEGHYQEKLKRLDRVLSSMSERRVGANYIIFGEDLDRVVVRESPLDSNFDLSYTLNTSGAQNSCHNN